MFKIKWDNRWTKEEKPVDRERPFHRINSPSYDTVRDSNPVSGRGYDCGCRSPFYDYESDAIDYIFGAIPGWNLLTVPIRVHVSSQILRAIPAWVPVERENIPSQMWNTLPEEEKEIEGVLSRSFQTWTDVPTLQWHWWYDWNFHIVPAPGYQYLRGKGNDNHGKEKESTRRVIKHPGTIECEWDCGAFGDYSYTKYAYSTPNLSTPGPMFNREANKDWSWPMAGQYVWIAGRWIYDCGHASGDKKTGSDVGLMRSELHPCKAIATARWEGVKFDENERYVPAIQFMFFACKRGGYMSFSGIDGTDYEFIVDLPEYEGDSIEYAIGQSPEYPINTLVVRPRLLIKLEYNPFDNAYGTKASEGLADPQVELLPPRNTGKAPQQVKVKIPLTQLQGQACDSYGVRVSLGWFDPVRTQAQKVKRVTVKFLEIRRVETHESGKAEWQIKFGVNGRWFAVIARGLVSETISIPIHRTISFNLAEDDYIYFNSHGMEEDDVGEVMRRAPDDRNIKNEANDPLQWERDIDQRDNDHASDVARVLAWDLASTLNNQNDPLGIVDPGFKLSDNDSPNPLQVRKLIELTGGPGRIYRGRLTARLTIDTDAELTYKPHETDYTLHYTIEYEDQPN